MRKLWTATAAWCLTVTAALAGQDPDPRAVVEKAVQAQGGADMLTRASAGQRKVKGTFHTDGFKFTGDSYSDAGNRLRIILRGDDDNPDIRILVLDGTKGWTSFNGATFDLDERAQQRMAKASYADKVSGLVTLLRDKGYTLTALGESKVKDTAVVGVKVQSDGMPDMQLFFDKAKGFLVKSAYRVTDFTTEQEVLQEVYYNDYQRYDPAAAEEQTLHKAKQAVDGPALIAYLRQRIPDKNELLELETHAGKLGDAAFGVRQKATAALEKAGPKAGGVLRQALKSEDRETARRAERLLDAIKLGPEPPLTSAVVRLLAIRRPAGAVAALLDYLPAACDEGVAKEVQNALVTLAERDAKDTALVAALKGSDPVRRTAALAALGQDGGAYQKQPWRRVVLEGVSIPRSASVYREGQRYMDLETFDHQFYNRLDDSLFGRP